MTSPSGYDGFLREQLATQPHHVMSHRLGDEQVWVKRAGEPQGTGRYRAMAVLAGLLRLPALRPVPNPGGPAAIATEVRRIRELAARGVRVPEILAVQDNGFVMRHLGRVGEQAHSLDSAIARALRAHDPAAVMALWQQGLDALAHVHRQGACLSQVFARNMVLAPSGDLVFIDFEDDPTAVLPLPLCHVRDALCYAHSTAIHTCGTAALRPKHACAGAPGWSVAAPRCRLGWRTLCGTCGGCATCPTAFAWATMRSGRGRLMTC